MPEARSAVRRRGGGGFTLIELLVVIAIIGLLVAIVIPALSSARMSAKISACLSNLREIGLAAQSYSLVNDGAIPRGPTVQMPSTAVKYDELASNQIWIGGLDLPNGIGSTLNADLRQTKVLYCPGDDTRVPETEPPKIDQRLPVDILTSYLYRQRDQTTRDRFDNLGTNGAGLPAKGLAMDLNTQDRQNRRSNHDALKVNIVYLDGHAQSVLNRDKSLQITADELAGFPSMFEPAINQLLVNADFAENGDPSQAPVLPGSIPPS